LFKTISVFVITIILVSSNVHLEAAECANAYGKSPQLNSMQLFRAAGSCFNEDKKLEGTFLLIAGQIRSGIDMSLLTPKSESDEKKVADLYGFLFYKAGGAGHPELYRDDTLSKKLFDLIEQWTPTFHETYDPGWQYRANSKVDRYKTTADEQKTYRIAQLKWYAERINNDEYYAIKKELDAISRRNPKGIDFSTADGKRSEELAKKQLEISKQFTSPKPKFKSVYRYEYEPDPNANYQQLFVGFNAPDTGIKSVTIFENGDEAVNSWLRDALTKEQMKMVIDAVDFKKQILISYYVGKRETVTGKVYITNVRFDKKYGGMSVAGRVGVNEPDCKYGRSVSYPFALAAVNRPNVPAKAMGHSTSNFGDGCKPPKSINFRGVMK